MLSLFLHRWALPLWLWSQAGSLQLERRVTTGLQAKRERGPFNLCVHRQISGAFSWALLGSCTHIWTSHWVQRSCPAWVTCPSLWPVGEDTVVDSPSEHRNEGEVAPPKEGVSADKTNLLSAQVESVPFPIRCFMLKTAYFVLFKGANFIYSLIYSFTVMGKTKPF